jgi:hypothetical protein
MIITATVCYNNPKVIEESINKYYELCYNKPDIHYILNDSYPLQKEKIKETLKKLSDKYGCVILESETNLGLQKGLLYLDSELNKTILNIKETDVIILYDSNSYPLTKDFDKALIECFKNPEIGIATLSPEIIKDTSSIKKDSITNYNYTEEPSFYTSITSLTYKAHLMVQANFNMFSKTYGDGSALLSNVKNIIAKNNLKYVALTDYKEKMFYFNNKEDIEYVKYKKFILNIKPKEHISFDTFLNLKYEYKGERTSINKEIFHFTGGTF